LPHPLTLPAGSHAVGRFAIPSDQFGPAWGYMYGEALARLEPDDGSRP